MLIISNIDAEPTVWGPAKSKFVMLLYEKNNNRSMGRPTKIKKISKHDQNLV